MYTQFCNKLNVSPRAVPAENAPNEAENRSNFRQNLILRCTHQTYMLSQQNTAVKLPFVRKLLFKVNKKFSFVEIWTKNFQVNFTWLLTEIDWKEIRKCNFMTSAAAFFLFMSCKIRINIAFNYSNKHNLRSYSFDCINFKTFQVSLPMSFMLNRRRKIVKTRKVLRQSETVSAAWNKLWENKRSKVFRQTILFSSNFRHEPVLELKQSYNWRVI